MDLRLIEDADVVLRLTLLLLACGIGGFFAARTGRAGAGLVAALIIAITLWFAPTFVPERSWPALVRQAAWMNLAVILGASALALGLVAWGARMRGPGPPA